MITHTFSDGKYTVIFHDSGKSKALRYGEEWRDLTGDGLVLAMLQDYDDLKEQYEFQTRQVADLQTQISELREVIDTMGDW